MTIAEILSAQKKSLVALFLLADNETLKKTACCRHCKGKIIVAEQ